jgi:hypothetical protein
MNDKRQRNDCQITFGQTSLSGVRRGFMPPQLKRLSNHY